MTATEEIEEALREDWSDEVLSVYADHLQALGDPRGELISLELDGADRADVIERRGQLIRMWLGADTFVETWWDGAERRWYAGNRAAGLWILPELGLLEVVHDDSSLEPPTALLRFLATPASQFVHRCSFASYTRGLRDAVRVLTSRARPWLRALALARQDGAIDVVLRDTSAFGASLPNLTHLALTGRHVLEDLDHAGVTELVVTGHAALSLRDGAPLPAVTTLDFALEPGASGGGLRALSRRRFPNLRRLVLSRQEPHHALGLAGLADLDVANQLTYLALPSLRSASDVRAVEGAADQMTSLRELAIARAYACFGDRRVELARARVRCPPAFPWPPLDQLARDQIQIGAEHGSTAVLIEGLEAVYLDLPPALAARWSRIWTSLATTGQATVVSHELQAALEPVPLDDAWRQIQRRLQWEGAWVSLRYAGA